MNVERDRVILIQEILECADKGLDVFGASVKTVIYWGLEHEYHLKKEEIATNPEFFCNHRKHIFGIGSELIERKITNELQKQFSADNLYRRNLAKAINLIKIESSRR